MSEDAETALVQELRALAGAAGDSSTFVVRHGGHGIEVSYSGGSCASLTFTAAYDRVARADHPALLARAGARTYREPARGGLVAARPLAIELRRENLGDVVAKDEGLNVEWQSGDEAFDRAVYVATPTTDPEIVAAVLGAEVRRGVLELLGLGFQRVSIDEGGLVRAYLSEFVNPSASRPHRGADAIRAFAAVLSDLPAIAASGAATAAEPFAGWTRLLGAIGGLGWAMNAGYVFGLMALLHELLPKAGEDVLSTGEVVVAVAVGIAAGLLGARLYGAAVRRRVQGTSLAHDRVSGAQIRAFGGFSVIAFTLFVTALALWEASGSGSPR